MDATQTQHDLSDELDKALLKAVRKSKKDMKGKDGKINVSVLNAATNRLRALGITKVVLPESEAVKLAEELGLDNPDTLKFPGISDDKATGTI